MGASTVSAVGPATRTILTRIDIAGTGKEAVIGVGEAQAGASIGAHSHPGEEIAYVVSGSMVLKIKGKPDRILHAGDSYTLPRSTVHDITGEGETSRVAVTWIVDKAEPFSTPAR